MNKKNPKITHTKEILQCKVVLLGASNSGKTSLLQKLVFDKFNETVIPTLGAGLSSYDCMCDSVCIKLNLWDTAGQENYRSLAKVYYRDAKVAVIVYDVTSANSFHDLEYWVQELSAVNCYSNKIIYIIGNKIDKLEDRVISKDQGRAYAAQKKAEYEETSALSGENVQSVFKNMAQMCLNTYLRNSQQNERVNEVVFKDIINQSDNNIEQSCC